MKRLLLTIALTCVLSGSVLAGEMPTCGITSQEPETTAVSGDIPSTDVGTTESEIPTLLTILLTILSVV
jgi:hypothetical protein